MQIVRNTRRDAPNNWSHGRCRLITAVKCHHWLLTGKNEIKTTENSEYFQGYGTTGTFTSHWWEWRTLWSLWKAVWQFFTKLDVHLPKSCVPSYRSQYTRKYCCYDILILRLMEGRLKMLIGISMVIYAHNVTPRTEYL